MLANNSKQYTFCYADMTNLIKATSKFVARRYRTRKIYLSPKILTHKLENIPINNPIFILGVQGGGLTILMKCLQRLDNTCFCHGNQLSWDAADNEMHVCIKDKTLPSELSFWQNQHYPETLPSNFYRYWTYATNEAIGTFRLDENSVTEKMTTDFQKMIKKIIRVHAREIETCRFIDKSQLYMVCVSAIAKLLEEAKPYFIVVGRNPLGSVPRTARNYYLNPKKHGYQMDYLKAVRLCAEHWSNSYELALKDGKKIENFKVMKIEDFFDNPKAFLKQFCEFANLEFCEDMLPNANQQPTIFQQMRSRWYPMRKSTTDGFRQSLNSEEKETILELCGEQMRALGYTY